ncbi:DEAD/DEAH box helicase [Paraconexibacter antarcticus]|uniref:DEAD/DEAH box helicase n=1 Tax=Paraconexibacter antarcticus TaxID=2949664 RepID=A0ABY5DQG7_9ACTN|nr:DEAD/DEAH box helicase [Paraconexibacter antarcticus]UTI63322.1 DEAD/DEAH box helicase [Paraconexibacter antarcticus]
MIVPPEEQLRDARARLVVLDRERAELRAGITELERHLGGPQTGTAEGRVALFASLFRGRADVFATRWQSRTKPGSSGWAPKCSNEWKPGVCEKPRVKCAVCAHRRFVAYSEAEVRRHLEGHQTIGIYPLLADETCWLLAIDLDGPSWKEDAGALREVAADAEVPVLVERSRSGQGAHVWLLFAKPVAARVARTIGSWLLTQAMSRRSISMASYDRLFPNQDTMPAGGFGNLIALPLQRDRRPDGCTLFLDANLTPYADQWSALAEAKRLDADRAGLLAAEAEKAGGTLALPHWADTKTRSPARPLPSGTAAPETLTARLRGRLEIATTDLPAGVRDRLRRTAAFANPVFYEREAARLSTHNTPRVIACHEDTGEHLLLPRGCLDAVRDELETVGTTLAIDDARTDGNAIGATFTGTLSTAQQAGVDALAKHDAGVLVAPPGSGKTVMATALIGTRGRSTLVLVHRRPLLEQWIQRLTQFLDLEPGQIGSPATTPGTSGIDVAMIQTLTRRDTTTLLDRYGHVVIDECHHVPAVSVERLLRDLPARHITGLTATPRRRDGHQPIIAMQCGPVRHTITVTHATETAVRRVLIERRTAFDASALPTDPGIQEILGAVATDPHRTKQIADDVLAELAAGRYPLVLTERREHLDALAALLKPTMPGLIVLSGGMGAPAQRRADAALADTDGPRVILATGRYIGEGFDDPRLDTLVLAMPIAWKGTMTQYAGRLHRHHDDKHEIRILDYVDHEIPVLRRMYAKRQRAYTALGYQPG